MVTQPSSIEETSAKVQQTEVARIRTIYASRESSIDAHRYTVFDPAHLLVHFSRQSAFLRLLKSANINSLVNLKILEVGCGAGGILLEYLGYGARPADLFGVDVLSDKLAQARQRSPNINILTSDAQQLPFGDGQFDLVTQYTVFSSVLHTAVRKQIANEMVRVLKPGGYIVWYDFWPNNPWNPDVRGIRLDEVKRLFPNAQYDIQRIVLAPPIARPLARISPLACQLLELVPWLRSNYMMSIFPGNPYSKNGR